MAQSYTVSYNGFTFENPKTSVESVVLYSDDGVSQIGVAYVFSIRFFMTGTSIADFATKLEMAKCQLTQRQCRFFITWDGNTIYDTNLEPDIDWGPHPSDVRIERFIGGVSAIGSWSVRIVAKSCFDAQCSLTGRGSEILALTRNWQFDIDPNGFTTRVVSGRLVVTAQTVARGLPADAYRAFILNTVPLPANYKRNTQNFSASSDGRVLDYSIADAEQMWTLPKPVSSGSAMWTSRTRDYGATIDYVLAGEFSAPASVSKNTIIRAIGQLAANRFPLGDANLVFESRELTESVYDNKVRFLITAWAAGSLTAKQVTGSGDVVGGSTASGFLAGLDSFGAVPPDYDGRAQWIGGYGQDGSINSGVIAAAPFLWDACLPVASTSGSQIPSGSAVTSSGPISSGSDPFKDKNGGVSDDHKASPWVAYKECISWEIDNKIVVFASKDPSGEPFIQQAASPTLTVIQAGYSTRIVFSPDDLPVPPAPFYSKDAIVMQNAYVENDSGDPVGAGAANKFTCRWRYVMRFKSDINNGTSDDGDPIGIGYPADPRRPGVDLSRPGVDNAKLQVSGLPELVEIPDDSGQ